MDLDKFKDGVDGKTSAGNPKPRYDPTKRKHDRKGQTFPKKEIRGYAYDMSGHVVASVDRYLELSGKNRNSLKPVSTPCIDDHQLDPADDLVRGELKEESAKIVLKALYVARINRTDLLWAVNSLAREVTRWSVNCDKRLHRLICYMHFSVDMQMECWVGDDPKDC